MRTSAIAPAPLTKTFPTEKAIYLGRLMDAHYSLLRLDQPLQQHEHELNPQARSEAQARVYFLDAPGLTCVVRLKQKAPIYRRI